jgi:hypothetical protein
MDKRIKEQLEKHAGIVPADRLKEIRVLIEGEWCKVRVDAYIGESGKEYGFDSEITTAKWVSEEEETLGLGDLVAMLEQIKLPKVQGPGSYRIKVAIGSRRVETLAAVVKALQHDPKIIGYVSVAIVEGQVELEVLSRDETGE